MFCNGKEKSFNNTKSFIVSLLNVFQTLLLLYKHLSTINRYIYRYYILYRYYSISLAGPPNGMKKVVCMSVSTVHCDAKRNMLEDLGPS